MAHDRILAIDDEPMIRQMIGRILDRAGYATTVAANGAQGLAAFRRERPHLVITDLIMPEREGIETIRQILREQPLIPVIAMSGRPRAGGMDFLAMAKELGARTILRKPFEPRELIEAVEDCLGLAPMPGA
jgi:CheY-like chemotaxis protein